jgi:hypothetical protein
MITSQLIVKKCRLTALEIAQKSSEGQFLKASRIWESYSALEDFWGKTIENFNKKHLQIFPTFNQEKEVF